LLIPAREVKLGDVHHTLGKVEAICRRNGGKQIALFFEGLESVYGEQIPVNCSHDSMFEMNCDPADCDMCRFYNDGCEGATIVKR